MEKTSTTPGNVTPVTIQHIAEAAGVDKSTVSLVLSGKGNISTATRTRILTLSAELDYEPDAKAQRLRSSAHSNLVCLCSGTADPLMGAEKIMLIQVALTGEGLEVPIYTSSNSAAGSTDPQVALIKQLRRQRPRAIICSAYMFNKAAFHELELYQRHGDIVVSYDIPVPLNCDQVIFDREHNAYQATRYLLQRGHRNVGIGMSRITSPVSDAVDVPQKLRLQGFRRAMEEFGLPVREEWLLEWLFEHDTFEEGGAAMAQHFMQLKERPTELSILNDYVTLAFMGEIMRASLRVPQDVSIVGLENQPLSSYCPVPLTSMSQPIKEIVQAVVTMVRERLAGSAVAPRTVTIRGKLVERQSVYTLA